MRSVVYSIVILSVLSTYPSVDAVSKRINETRGCVEDGAFHPVGYVFKRSPCMTCTCKPTGKFLCYSIMCGRPRCMDFKKNSSTCCSTCPNGENCRGPDGVAVSVGSYTFSKAGVCSCPVDWAGWSAHCWCPVWPLSAILEC
ncbi:von Willebrand factor c domain-containing protein 2-like protein [Plakobranchus ocellatus]|uniref:von Willebrand factor c domain-containing protein 2-like protein n=1 Tax=Plakobranchus ocellatus TaxID=259542 RepID=A0AAV3ZC12_9GAST|nr:von Willebrand factor c domain-containing protein 2-like protein [Plakobranchus ocellatus]